MTDQVHGGKIKTGDKPVIHNYTNCKLTHNYSPKYLHKVTNPSLL